VLLGLLQGQRAHSFRERAGAQKEDAEAEPPEPPAAAPNRCAPRCLSAGQGRAWVGYIRASPRMLFVVHGMWCSRSSPTRPMPPGDQPSAAMITDAPPVHWQRVQGAATAPEQDAAGCSLPLPAGAAIATADALRRLLPLHNCRLPLSRPGMCQDRHSSYNTPHSQRYSCSWWYHHRCHAVVQRRPPPLDARLVCSALCKARSRLAAMLTAEHPSCSGLPPGWSQRPPA
jgi:hypothetical protein